MPDKLTNHPVKRQLAIMAATVAALVLGCFALAHVHAEQSLGKFFDNLQWTIAHVGAALLAWWALRRRDQDQVARRWFAWALGWYALGQIVWDVQIFTGWTPFPAPSDVFYALSGPCLGWGFWQVLRQRVSTERARVVALDLAILLIQMLVMVAVLYLSQAPTSTTLQLLQLCIYPAVMFGAVLTGLVMVLELGLRVHWGWTMLVLGVTLRGVAWMRWNIIDLSGTPANGSWLNFSFALASWLAGAGAAWFAIDDERRTAGNRASLAFHAFIPVVPVLAAVTSVLMVWESYGVPRALRALVLLGAVVVIVLAVMRQSKGLAERERLLQTERRMSEKDDQYRELAQRLEIATSAARLGIWEVNLTRRIGVWDRRMFELYGFSPACGQDPFAIWDQSVHPDDHVRVREQLHATINDQREAHLEFRILWPNGELHHIEAFAVSRQDPVTRHTHLTGVSWDVTSRVLARRALAESEAELRAIFDNAVIGVVLIDEHRNIIRHNQAVRDLLGYDLHSAMDLHGDDILHPEEQAQSRAQLAELVSGRRQSYLVERRYRCANGQYRWVRTSVYPVRLNSNRCFVVLIEDIEARKQMQLALEAAQAEEKRLRDEFTYSLLNVQERERLRIANELHDSLGQSLSVIKNRAQLAAESLSAESPAALQVHGILRVTAEAIAETRRLAHNLRPLHIEQLGLTAAIQQLLDQQSEASRLRVSSRLENIDDAFAPEQITHIYRLVQEALNNVNKHAHASEVRVFTERDLHAVRIRIEDDGCGFVAEQLPTSGLGLTSMRERAQMLGGSVAVHSQSGAGTRIAIELPVVDTEAVPIASRMHE